MEPTLLYRLKDTATSLYYTGFTLDIEQRCKYFKKKSSIIADLRRMYSTIDYNEKMGYVPSTEDKTQTAIKNGTLVIEEHLLLVRHTEAVTRDLVDGS